ncbi:MAG TPA: hypothetical protein VN851_25310 [Thermoanaerobaculia bacterium]|nr:hypothetical protein [Thermoanaerobaculia bacterium]
MPRGEEERADLERIEAPRSPEGADDDLVGGKTGQGEEIRTWKPALQQDLEVLLCHSILANDSLFA